MNDLVVQRFLQARESLENARTLLEDGMDADFVLTSAYYAFYHPVVALMYEGAVPETMQSVTLGLFEQRFVATGKVPEELARALRRAFDARPRCGNEGASTAREELAALVRMAQEFIELAEVIVRTAPACGGI